MKQRRKERKIKKKERRKVTMNWSTTKIKKTQKSENSGKRNIVFPFF